MIFEKNTTPEVVKVLIRTRPEFFYNQKGNILFRKIVDLLIVCFCLVGLVALKKIFAQLYFF